MKQELLKQEKVKFSKRSIKVYCNIIKPISIGYRIVQNTANYRTPQKNKNKIIVLRWQSQ